MVISSNVVLTLDRLEREVEFFGNAGQPMVYDVETVPSSQGADDRGVPSHNQVTWVGLATKGHAIQIAMGHPIGSKVIGETKEPRADKNGKVRMFRVPVYDRPPEQLTRADVFPLLNKLLADPGIIKAAHGATFDNASVAKYRGGLIPAGPLPCTIVMRWLTNENIKRYGLKYATKDVYGFAYDDEEVGRHVETYPFGMVAHYLHCDVTYTWLEYQRNKKKIQEQGLDDLLKLETDLTSVLSHMRTKGIRIDTDQLTALRDDLSVRVEEIEGHVYAAAGRKFNINAVGQKQALLFKPKSDAGQGLKPWKLTDGGKDKKNAGATPDHTFYSTDEESLEGFKGNAVVDALLDYQESSKILGTYVYGYLGVEGDKDKPARIFDGRVYADFVQYGTVTGRFSCRTPNLQNVGRPDTELGKLVRGLFVADPGWKLIVNDYSQVELVILAHLVGEGRLFDGFHNGVDPHTLVAAMVLGKKPFISESPGDGGITKDERQKKGKSLSFAVVYGAGAGKVASMAGVSVPEAKELLKRYDEMFPEVPRLRQKTLREARRHSVARTGQPPHVTTIMGRKRRLPGLNSPDDGLRMYNERQAFNSLVQGSSADITKQAMIRFHQMKKPHWEMLMTVHDEIVATAPENEAEECQTVLTEAMAGPDMQKLLTVPLKVSTAIVNGWNQAK